MKVRCDDGGDGGGCGAEGDVSGQWLRRRVTLRGPQTISMHRALQEETCIL